MDIKKIIEEKGKKPENAIQILKEVQKINNYKYLSSPQIKIIADELGLSESKIVSLLSFYTLITEKYRGKYVIQICTNVSCYVNGSNNIVKEFEKELGIKMGETTSDGLFTLEYTSCIGCCNIAPAIRIGNKKFGELTPQKIQAIISKCRENL